MSPWLKGRQAFLETIEEIWQPRPLKRLADIEPDLVPWLQQFPELMPAATELGRELKRVAFNAVPSPIRWVNLLDDSSTEAVAARSALVRWRGSWGERASSYLGTPWVMDAALHSVAYKLIEEAPALTWAYSPPSPAHPLLITRETGLELEREVRAHNRGERDRFGVKGNTERDVEWTVRWLLGESDLKLAETAYKGTEDRVKKARSRYMQDVGLTVSP